MHGWKRRLQTVGNEGVIRAEVLQELGMREFGFIFASCE
jgi:hypothetical protein